MIRPAVITDLDSIEDGYCEHFAHEREHVAYTVFREGVYPTRKDAEKALQNGTLFVYEENGIVLGSVILDWNQPEEYKNIHWPTQASDMEVNVIHLLMVRPSAAGKGIGSALISYLADVAKKRSCKVIRLDTGAQNIPAATLYKKRGFRLIENSSMNVGGTIPHKGHLFFERVL